MRITARDLKRIINEEIARSLFEGDVEGGVEYIKAKPLSDEEYEKRMADMAALEAEMIAIFGDEKENMKKLQAALDGVKPIEPVKKESHSRRYRR